MQTIDFNYVESSCMLFSAELILRESSRFFRTNFDGRFRCYPRFLVHHKKGWIRESFIFTDYGKDLHRRGLISMKSLYSAGGMGGDPDPVYITIPSNGINMSFIHQSFFDKVKRIKNLPFWEKVIQELENSFAEWPNNNDLVVYINRSQIICDSRLCLSERWTSNKKPRKDFLFASMGMTNVNDQETLCCLSVALIELLFEQNCIPPFINCIEYFSLPSLTPGGFYTEIKFIYNKPKPILAEW